MDRGIMITLYNMDVMKALKQIPDESIDMQITSPPYYGLRDYGKETESIWDGEENCEHEWVENKSNARGGGGKNNIVGANRNTEANNRGHPTISNFCQKCNAWKGQLGLEPDFNLYLKHLLNIFDGVKRVLKKDGTCWVNLADTHGGSNQGNGQREGQGSGLQNASKGYFASSNQRPPMAKIMPKCLLMIPERFAIGMVEGGWILRNKICWYKRNHMPTSVKDRFSSSWEYLFLFSKNKKYYFDHESIRVPHKTSS